MAQIARRAGLTERTFFRHFADKREVLFWGAGTLQEFLVHGVAAAPGARALSARSPRPWQSPRPSSNWNASRGPGGANAELQERELIKLAALSEALANTLRQRGIGDPAASLGAEAGIAVFKIAFERWIAEANHQGFGALIRESLEELKAVAAAACKESAVPI